MDGRGRLKRLTVVVAAGIAVAGCGPFCGNANQGLRQLSAKEIALQQSDLPSGWTVNGKPSQGVAALPLAPEPKGVTDVLLTSYTSPDLNTTVESDVTRFATATDAITYWRSKPIFTETVTCTVAEIANCAPSGARVRVGRSTGFGENAVEYSTPGQAPDVTLIWARGSTVARIDAGEPAGTPDSQVQALTEQFARRVDARM